MSLPIRRKNMPIVDTSLKIANVNIQRVWNVLCDFEKYPDLMDDVIEVKCFNGSIFKSSWKVLLNGSELTWDEEDIFEPYQRIIFHQLEGDLEVYKGEWQLEKEGNDVTVTLIIEFDLGIPSLADMLNPIGIKAIKSNSRQMLEAIKDTSS
jgi:uncharacterized membrane protein